MNIVTFQIKNCCDCPHSYIEKIYTPDSFEHEEGIYCSKVTDTKSYNMKNKLIASDDWNLEKISLIPDWCPLLKGERI